MILRVSLGRDTFPPTMKENLWRSSKGLEGSMSVEEYRQQMELLLLRDGLREEERISIEWSNNS